MDEAETVAAAAFNAQQEIDDLENSTTISDDRNGMSSDPYCTVGEQEIHKSRYLNMLLAADGKAVHGSSKKSFDRLKRVAGEAKFNVAKESSVQRAAELAADHVRKWTEDIVTMDSDGEEDDFWCKNDPVAFLCRGVEARSKSTTTCLVVGRMKSFGRNGKAVCEQRMPAINLSGWCIDVSVEVIESHQEDPTKIKTTGNVAFEIPKIKASDITPLNPAIEVIAPGIHVNVMDLSTLEELKGILIRKGTVVNLPKQTSLSPYYPLKSAQKSILVADSESADDSRLASSLECKLCQPPRLISYTSRFERGYRNHVARHIMEQFPGMSSEPCGQCGDAACTVSVSGGNEVSVECRLKFQPFKMNSCNKVTQLFPSTNHPVVCTICDKCVWTYSLEHHYNLTHNVTVIPLSLQCHLPFKPDTDPSKNESMLLVKKYKINKDGSLI